MTQKWVLNFTVIKIRFALYLFGLYPKQTETENIFFLSTWNTDASCWTRFADISEHLRNKSGVPTLFLHEPPRAWSKLSWSLAAALRPITNQVLDNLNHVPLFLNILSKKSKNSNLICACVCIHAWAWSESQQWDDPK